MVVDYVLFASSGLDAFNYKSAYASSVPPDDQEYDPTLDPLVVDGGTGFIFIFCIMANSMAFFMVSATASSMPVSCVLGLGQHCHLRAHDASDKVLLV